MKTPFQQQVQRQQQQLRRNQQGYYWLKQQEAARRAREQAARGQQPALAPGARPLPRRGVYAAARPPAGVPAPRRRRRPVRATLFFLVALPVLAWLSLMAYGFLSIEVAFPDGMAAIGALAVALVGFLLVCRWTGRIYSPD